MDAFFDLGLVAADVPAALPPDPHVDDAPADPVEESPPKRYGFPL